MSSSTQETVNTLLSELVLPRIKSEICESRRVLVTDDEPVVRYITKALLEKFGFKQVDEAIEGTAALALLRQHDFALVISDLLMKPMSGLELYREMRSDRRLRDTPFVLLTASFSHEHVNLAQKIGLKHYLLKPFRLEALQRKLIEVLAPYSITD